MKFKIILDEEHIVKLFKKKLGFTGTEWEKLKEITPKLKKFVEITEEVSEFVKKPEPEKPPEEELEPPKSYIREDLVELYDRLLEKNELSASDKEVTKLTTKYDLKRETVLRKIVDHQDWFKKNAGLEQYIRLRYNPKDKKIVVQRMG